MAQDNIQFVEDIYKRAPRGVVELAYHLGVNTRTIERWRECGIPDKYWAKLDDLYGIKPIECFQINCRIKNNYKLAK